MQRLILIATIPVLSLVTSLNAFAHEVRPAYLELQETSQNIFDVTWKVPLYRDAPLYIRPILPDNARPLSPVITRPARASEVRKWSIEVDGGLEGTTIAIDNLDRTITDVLIRISFLNGATHTVRLTPQNTSAVVPEEPSRVAVAKSYFGLGVEHILGGIDHLLFVLALLLLVHGVRLLIETITAFTVAHSITLALATMGFVHVPSGPVEAVIALSIVFVATEILHKRAGSAGLTERAPWLVAFSFGLLHGFGFAGALSELGLPQTSIPLALFFFNVGVEAGQLMFVTIVLILMKIGRNVRLPIPASAGAVPPYAIGSIAMFWVFQRVIGFWP